MRIGQEVFWCDEGKLYRGVVRGILDDGRIRAESSYHGGCSALMYANSFVKTVEEARKDGTERNPYGHAPIEYPKESPLYWIGYVAFVGAIAFVVVQLVVSYG